VFYCVLSPSHSSSHVLGLLSCFSVTATKVARVFSFIPLKEAPQPLDANLDQRLIRVGLLGLMWQGHDPTGSSTVNRNFKLLHATTTITTSKPQLQTMS
jgi:hypothetical protein